MPKEAYNLECLVPSVKHGGQSVIIWAAMSWYSSGPITIVMISPLPTRRNGLLGADLTCET